MALFLHLLTVEAQHICLLNPLYGLQTGWSCSTGHATHLDSEAEKQWKGLDFQQLAACRSVLEEQDVLPLPLPTPWPICNSWAELVEASGVADGRMAKPMSST